MQFDFNSIKTDLENRLSLLSEWSKVLFYGVYSNLLSVVAYIVEKLAYLADVYYRESNWETAIKMKSMMNQAKFLGYTPHRKIGASGYVKVSADETFDDLYVYSGTSVVIPRWTPFANENGDVFVYATEEATYYRGTSGSLSVPVKEGTVSTYTYTATGEKNEVISITSDSIDNDEVQVEIVNSLGENLYDVNICGNLSGTTQSGYAIYHPDKLYFVNDTTNYFCEIETESTFDKVNVKFGDNIYGRQLTAGELVKITYGITQGANGNITQTEVISKFQESILDADGVEVDLYVTNDAEISDGSNAEDIESIRNNGNRLFSTGYRTGSGLDWKTILEEHPYIHKATVSNSEDLGIETESNLNKVYITAISKDGSILTDAQKTDVVLYLKDENKKGITEVVSWYDPIVITLLFKINAWVYEQTFVTVENLIDDTLESNYGILNTDFQQNVYWSNYTTVLDGVDYIDHHETEVWHLEKNVSKTESLYTIGVSFTSSRTSVAIDQVYLQPNTLEIWIHRKRSGVWDTDIYKIAEDQSKVIVGLQGDLPEGQAYAIVGGTSYISYIYNQIAYSISTIDTTYGNQNPGESDPDGYILSLAYKTRDGNGEHLDDIRLPENRCITDIDSVYVIKNLEYI